MKQLNFKLLLAFLLSGAFLISSWGPTLAQNSENQTPTQGGPISISSDHMSVDDNKRIITFTGRVIARQDDLVITCDLMLVHYQPKGSYENSGLPLAKNEPTNQQTEPTEQAKSKQNPLGGGQEIDRVDCEGAVKIQQGEKLAVGQKALYLAKAKPRRLILTGEARVWQGQNSVTGHQVTYYLDENRSQVESQDSQRVRAFYDQSSSKEEKP